MAVVKDLTERGEWRGATERESVLNGCIDEYHLRYVSSSSRQQFEGFQFAPGG